MAGTFYFYYQKTPESEWVSGLASHREAITDDKLPPFTTVLDLDTLVEDGMNAEDLDKIKYRGGYYADLDNDDLDECIDHFKRYLTKLEDKGVDLEDCRLYATGGRGFHIIVPEAVFIAQPVRQGYQHLPLIYKEMAYGLIVDSLDLRVYSAKRGRMWRTENVERTNGAFKVEITLQEARRMDSHLFARVCSEVRLPLHKGEPKFTPDLGIAFSAAKDKVAKALAGRKKTKIDDKLVAKWKGNYPDTLKGIMSGEIPSTEGFQHTATQLAIAAHALGKTEDEFVKACEGLCKKHEGDSSRYGSEGKRKNELRRMYAYMAGNPCYSFSVGGLKSVIAKGTPTPDLDNGFKPATTLDEEGNEIPVQSGEASLTVGVQINKDGIWKMKEGEKVLACSIGMDEPYRIVDLKTNQVVGYEVTGYLDNKCIGKQLLTMDMLSSVARFKSFVLPHSASLQMTESEVAAMPEILRKRTDQDDSKVYIVSREGVDLVRHPDAADPDEYDMIYAHGGDVVSKQGHRYRWRNEYGSHPTFNSDLHKAPALTELSLEKKEEAKEFFHKFFNLNTRENVAKVVGFMVAAFLSQPIRRTYGEFPMLQIYGTAGSGKSAYVNLVSHMHYFKSPPQISAAGSMTKFTMEQFLMSSASIPAIWDEVKPREMQKGHGQMLKMAMRNNYNNNQGGKGQLKRDNGTTTISVARIANEAPLVVIGEALEGQAAIMDRSILVTMSPEGRARQSENFRWCQQRRQFLSSFGWSCVQGMLSPQLDIDAIVKIRERFLDQIYPVLGERADKAERPIKNYATILTGLEFGRQVMKKAFGEEFNYVFEMLELAILSRIDSIIPFNQSEASQVMNTLAYMSTSDSPVYQFTKGADYDLKEIDGVQYIDIVLRAAFDKYARFQRSQGSETLFDDDKAFISAMHNHPAVTDRICVDTIETLKGGRPSVKVARFRLDILYETERVEEFKGIPAPKPTAIKS